MTFDVGYLYWAPAGTDMGGEDNWIPLGVTETGYELHGLVETDREQYAADLFDVPLELVQTPIAPEDRPVNQCPDCTP